MTDGNTEQYQLLCHSLGSSVHYWQPDGPSQHWLLFFDLTVHLMFHLSNSSFIQSILTEFLQSIQLSKLSLWASEDGQQPYSHISILWWIPSGHMDVNNLWFLLVDPHLLLLLFVIPLLHKSFWTHEEALPMKTYARRALNTLVFLLSSAIGLSLLHISRPTVSPKFLLLLACVTSLHISLCPCQS